MEGWMGYPLALLPSSLSPREFSLHLAFPFLLFPSLLYPSIQTARLYLVALLYLQQAPLTLAHPPHLTDAFALLSLYLSLSFCKSLVPFLVEICLPCSVPFTHLFSSLLALSSSFSQSLHSLPPHPRIPLSVRS